MRNAIDRLAIATHLATALQGLLTVAAVRDDIQPQDALHFEAARDAAGEVLMTVALTNDPTIEHVLGLAGALRGLSERCNTCVTGMEPLRAAAVALAAFDRTPLPLYGHFQTGITVAEEEFVTVGVTTEDEASYEQTGHKGELFAYLPCEPVVAHEIVHRIARGEVPAPDADQTERALCASKALIEALLAGEKRSEGDLRDTLSNFEGLAL